MKFLSKTLSALVLFIWGSQCLGECSVTQTVITTQNQVDQLEEGYWTVAGAVFENIDNVDHVKQVLADFAVVSLPRISEEEYGLSDETSVVLSEDRDLISLEFVVKEGGQCVYKMVMGDAEIGRFTCGSSFTNRRGNASTFTGSVYYIDDNNPFKLLPGNRLVSPSCASSTSGF